ncbi:MAG: hypothetical protein N838_18415 [Thiohalocapsa sp. PB-PSB1]|nr:MAG: hypothetical protein N838_18415 [Thiohalocapsa sp. PB-PSB1]
MPGIGGIEYKIFVNPHCFTRTTCTDIILAAAIARNDPVHSFLFGISRVGLL